MRCYYTIKDIADYLIKNKSTTSCFAPDFPDICDVDITEVNWENCPITYYLSLDPWTGEVQGSSEAEIKSDCYVNLLEYYVVKSTIVFKDREKVETLDNAVFREVCRTLLQKINRALKEYNKNCIFEKKAEIIAYLNLAEADNCWVRGTLKNIGSKNKPFYRLLFLDCKNLYCIENYTELEKAQQAWRRKEKEIWKKWKRWTKNKKNEKLKESTKK